MNKKAFTFTGSGDQYFKIWIVNILLTIVTLGIYSAWATVRKKRYFYGNTVLDENNFEYHGKPLQILIGRVIAILLLVAYVFFSETLPLVGMGIILLVTLAMPWLVMRSMKFNARMSSYRNVRFSFHGLTWDAYKYYLLIPMFPVIVGCILAALSYYVLGIKDELIITIIGGLVLLGIFILIPLAQTLMLHYQFNNLKYGQGQFLTKVQAKPIYIIYLKLVGIVVFCYLAIGLLIGGLSLLSGGSLFADGKMNETMIGILIIGAIPLYLSFLLFGIYAKSYLQSHKRNYLFANTSLDDVLTLASNLNPWSLFKILATNLLLIMVSMGIAKPWIEVRTHKHILEHTFANIDGELNQYVSSQQQKTSAFGDEMGDAFDLEGGFEVGI